MKQDSDCFKAEKRLAEAHDVTIQINRKLHTDINISEMHILRRMCPMYVWNFKISNEPFEISHQILDPYTAQYVFTWC